MDSSIKLAELNEFICCPVCHGYLIDATTVNECLHTFCKSCIMKHIKSDNYHCPKCRTVIHEQRPLENLKYDRNKQDIVFKLVPQLYISELRRKMAVQDFQDIDQITKQVIKKKFIYVALVQRRRMPATFTETTINSTTGPDATQKAKSDVGLKNNSSTQSHIYLKCPIDVRVRQIRKLLAIKYQLDANDRLLLLYKGDTVSDHDQISNLGQSISFVLQYEISRIYPTLDQASTSSGSMSQDSDKMSIDEIN